MSKDERSDDEFLARWSRRKREARAQATQPDPAAHDEVQSAPPPAVTDDAADFDLSGLPSLDAITAATDIKAFLRKGVPQELIRAALRRAWSTDPAIRDFVGLAENAWDFNDPTAMPGFGPLDYSEGELAGLVDRIVGGLRQSAELLPETSVEAADCSRELPQAETSSAAVVGEESETMEFAPVPVAPQPAVAETIESEDQPIRRRTHGGALPR